MAFIAVSALVALAMGLTAPALLEPSPECFSPVGLATRVDGSVVVLDAGQPSILTYDDRGQLSTRVPVAVTADARLAAVDSRGRSYLLEPAGRVSQVAEDGAIGWTRTAPGASYTAVATDAQDNVYLVDASHPGAHGPLQSQIWKLDPAGQLLARWENSASQASGTGPYKRTSAVAVDSQGGVYVVDAGYGAVYLYDQMGRYRSSWNLGSLGIGSFGNPSSLAIAPDGSVYVLGVLDAIEEGRARPTPQVVQLDERGTLVRVWGGLGTAEGLFESPSALAIDPAGNIYVADTGNHRIQKFDTHGTFQLAWP